MSVQVAAADDVILFFESPGPGTPIEIKVPNTVNVAVYVGDSHSDPLPGTWNVRVAINAEGPFLDLPPCGSQAVCRRGDLPVAVADGAELFQTDVDVNESGTYYLQVTFTPDDGEPSSAVLTVTATD